ncbi:hypothetical protein QJQ45_023791, partial [Haematococcus lacustris]
PQFREAATRLLSMHVTTAAAERNWSAWGLTYEAGRAQLGIEKTEKLVACGSRHHGLIHHLPDSVMEGEATAMANGYTPTPTAALVGACLNMCIGTHISPSSPLASRCPQFREAATRLLSMHVTTAAAERNWSAWGLTYEAGRAQLGIEKTEKLVACGSRHHGLIHHLPDCELAHPPVERDPEY